MSNLPNVSKEDSNNSGVYNKYLPAPHFSNTGDFTGIPTDTTGFNSITVTINASVDSTPCGLLIQFSTTGIDFDNNGTINYSTVYFSDTVYYNSLATITEQQQWNNKFSGSGNFIKSYPLIKQYYRISYTPQTKFPDTLIINSRLNSNNYDNKYNSVNSFENNKENLYDAMDKLRISYPVTILDLRIPVNPLYLTETAGSTGYNYDYLDICFGNTGTGITEISSQYGTLVLSVNGQSKIISQSRKYCFCESGKSILLIAPGVIAYDNNYVYSKNYYTKIGYFDDINGLFFQFNPSTNTLDLGIRNNSIDVLINQTVWNIDKMDGTGISGVNLDFTQMQIFVIDMNWMALGRLRFGFYLFGKINYCHQILNINNSTYPYICNVNLPTRYEIDGTLGGTGSASITQSSATIISEGGYNPGGKKFSICWSANYNITSETPIFALRGGGDNYYHQNIVLTKISLGSSNINDIFIYKLRLYLNQDDAPIDTTTNWVSPDSSTTYGSISVSQYTTGSFTALNTNNSIIIDSGIITRGNSINLCEPDNFLINSFQITGDINNSSSVIVMTVENITTTIYGCVSWTEIY